MGGDGTGSYGAGLAAYLEHAGEWVLGVDRPRVPRPATAPSPTTSMPPAMVRTAHRIQALDREIRDHDRDLRQLTKTACPQLGAEFGVGPIVAANTSIAWSHPGRGRSEAARSILRPPR